ncbi:WecB/TagA/CpsF family glycosyltransferase, partial [Acinetobacter baumannii]
IWASKFLGKKIKARITGLDLLPIYLEECYRKNYSMFFLGAAEGVAQKLKEFCEEKYPGIKIAGVFTPPYRSSFNEAENETMVA